MWRLWTASDDLSSDPGTQASGPYEAVGSGVPVHLPGVRQSGGQHVANSGVVAACVIVGGGEFESFWAEYG